MKKAKKNEWRTIEAIVGSVIITPKEIEAFKKHGIDLLVALKKIQREIYKKPKK
jgi:hypothetical protein